LSTKAGIFFTSTVGFPGIHGATVLGMHGIGVNTPLAEAVAEATVGFAKDWHIPKVAIFTIGLKSIIFAIGTPAQLIILSGNTVKEPGAIPKVHFNKAPLTTKNPIINFFSFFYQFLIRTDKIRFYYPI
jgi:hypothetical protein